MRKDRSQRNLTEFQAKAIGVLIREPRQAGQFTSAMGYNTISSSPWAIAAKQGTHKLNLLKALGFAYRDSDKIWHVTELGINRYLNYLGEKHATKSSSGNWLYW